MPKLWTESRGVIAATANDIGKANAINALLVRPIGLLPQSEGDPVKPFALGVWTDIRALLKPDVTVTALRKATSTYTHTIRYYFACAQPDAQRHDVDGNPIGAVSDEDRLAAQTKYLSLKTPLPPVIVPPVEDPVSQRASLIRAGILSRSRPSPSVN